MKFSDFVCAMKNALEMSPEIGELEVFATDGQCAHTELSGFVFREKVDEWPTEFCIDECLNGAGEFVRIS